MRSVGLPMVADLWPLTGPFFVCVLWIFSMTIISTAQEPTEFDFPLEENSSNLELRAYPPVDDAINFVKDIDWSDLGVRIRKGTGALLLFAMKFSEKSYDFHEYLYTRLNGMK